MKKFSLNLSNEDYKSFKSSSHTRLYDHQRDAGGDVTIWTNKPYGLAADLERAIDFGATSAVEVLGLPYRPAGGWR